MHSFLKVFGFKTILVLSFILFTGFLQLFSFVECAKTLTASHQQPSSANNISTKQIQMTFNPTKHSSRFVTRYLTFLFTCLSVVRGVGTCRHSIYGRI
jgi:hypothetical protein